MKNLNIAICMVVIISLTKVQAQTDQNYVRTHSYRQPIVAVPAEAESMNLDNDKVSIQTQYFDGLGRHVQTVRKENSYQGRDVVTHIEYDYWGRQIKSYLPFSETHLTETLGTDGQYYSDAKNEQNHFYDTQYGGFSGSYAFSKTTFESSPLKRVVSTHAPGKVWYLRPTTSSHEVNDNDDQVALWTIEDQQLVSLGFYEKGALRKTVIRNENSGANQGEMIEFKDKHDRIVLKKIKSESNTYLETYFIYDHFGDLRYVLPPMVSASYNATDLIAPNGYTLITEDKSTSELVGTKFAYAPSAKIIMDGPVVPAFEIVLHKGVTLDKEFIQTWAFQYDYDKRQRMTMKKVPGADSILMVYDKRDRLVMSQDGNQRIQNQWAFTKYDELNRPVLTGIIADSRTRTQIQEDIDLNLSDYNEGYTGSGLFHGYDGSGYPTHAVETDLMTVTYYDDYAFTADSHWTLGDYSAEPKAKNLVLGSKVKVPGHGWNESLTLYDSRYRVISSRSRDYLGNEDTFVNQYYNIVHPQVTQTIHTHKSQITNDTTTITQDYLYDHADRLLSVTHQVNDETAVVILENEYNELGELITKKLNKETANQYSQEIDYQYNIRGWLTKINDPVAPDASDYFNMQLKYDEAGQYNGNIGATSWKNPFETATNNYAYSYDAVNRIKSAGYSTTATGGMDFDLSDVTYDANGNILTLQRTGNHADQVAQLFDDLDYDYVGNQLTKVTDASGKDTGFKDGANTTHEYVYDANGNMISDANKGIDSIVYNHLNLPIRVEMNADGSNRIEYIYDAAGIKMAQLVYGADTLTKRTDYQGAFIYEDGVLQFIQHEEGRIVIAIPPGAGEAIFDYQYHLKDHLGNVRATFKTDIDTDTYEATLETENDATESQYFQNLTTRATHGSANKTTNGNEAAALSNSAMVGPAISLKVLPGDTIDMEVWAYYEGGSGYNSQVTLASFISSLAATFGGTSGAGGESGAIFDGIDDAVTAGAGGIGGSGNDAVPAAYLSYILFDDHYNEIQNGYQEITSSASFAHEKLFLNDIDINQAGYLYIYTSMQSDVTSPVYFDDLKITHTHSPIVSKDDYYPFGLTFNGYSRPAGTAQNFKYQSKELIKDLGLEMTDFGARLYQPDLGRWMAIDGLADKYISWSPYVFALNKPSVYVDLDGFAVTDPIKNLKVPNSPDDVDLTHWKKNPNHKAPGSQQWVDKYGNKLTFDKGVEGKAGWNGKDHWHYEDAKGNRYNKYGKPTNTYGGNDGHFNPGEETQIKLGRRANNLIKKNKFKGGSRGRVSKASGRLNMLTLVWDYYKGLKGDPHSLGMQFIEGFSDDKLYYNETKGVYWQRTKGDEIELDGEIVGTEYTFTYYSDYTYDEKQEKYVGTGKSYSETSIKFTGKEARELYKKLMNGN